MRLIIKKLFGKYDYDINFNKPINVLIGENGCGKTTILRIINYISNRDFIELAKIKFDKIIISNDDKSDEIIRNDLLQHDFVNKVGFHGEFYKFLTNYINSNFKKYVVGDKKKYDVKEKDFFDCFYSDLIEHFSNNKIKYNYNYFYYDIEKDIDFFFGREGVGTGNIIDAFKLFIESISSVYGSKLYFEQIFRFYLYIKIAHHAGIPNDYISISGFLENGYYGLSDRCDDKLNGIISYMNAMDIIPKSNLYDYVTFFESDQNFHNQLRNIRYFSDDTWNKLIEAIYSVFLNHNTCSIRYDEDDKEVIINLFNMILNDYHSRRRGFRYESKIKAIMFKQMQEYVDNKGWASFDYVYNFMGVCVYLLENASKIWKMIDDERNKLFNDLASHYIFDKNISINEYVISTKNLSSVPLFKATSESDIIGIKTRTGQYISYYQLSSGEKKIIRLIKMMAFDKKDYKYLLIDEPELSLSPYWQEMLLEDIQGRQHLLHLGTYLRV